MRLTTNVIPACPIKSCGADHQAAATGNNFWPSKIHPEVILGLGRAVTDRKHEDAYFLEPQKTFWYL